MKKLLAIAVAVAFAAPAMADTSVYGKAHVSVNKTSGQSLDMQSHTSRIGLKGSNALDNGLTATHKFELGINLTEGGGLSSRDTWVGLKGGFGEVRFGRHTLPSDIYDDHADFMTNGHGLDRVLPAPLGTRRNNVLAYLGAFGPVSVAVAHIANGANGAGVDKANDLGIGYKAGPIQATIGYTKAKNLSAGNRIALSYSGANYGLGFVHEKQVATGDKANTLSGKYSFGKAYLAAEYGKASGNNDKGKSQIIEVGYGLGKGTKTYLEHSKQTDAAGVSAKNTRLGLVHSF